MPSFTVNVDIDLSDLLYEVSDDDLLEEIEERNLSPLSTVREKREVRLLLQDCSDFLRKGQRENLALGLDDLMSELGLV